jgi:hypothetical protein
MTGYYSRTDELEKMIEKNLERQGVRDPKLRKEMAKQQVYMIIAEGKEKEVEGYRRYYGEEPARRKIEEIISRPYQPKS